MGETTIERVQIKKGRVRVFTDSGWVTLHMHDGTPCDPQGIYVGVSMAIAAARKPLLETIRLLSR